CEGAAAPGCDFAGELTLNLGHLDNNASATLTLPQSSDGELARFHCRREGWQIGFESDGEIERVNVLLHTSRRVSKVANGRTIRQSPLNTLVEWTDTNEPMTVTLND
ncbi:MAG TPA: hypothetical protein VF624_18470, partial [Tepidisphaeraceae bacterium]